MSSRNQFRSEEFVMTLKQLSSIGINTVFLITFHYAKNETSDSLYATKETVSDSALEEIIKLTIQEGLSPVLKPHIDLENGSFRYKINPCNYNRWVDSYKKILLRYSNLSNKYNLNKFVIGTELDNIADSKEFHDLLDNEIKPLFKGDLIYSSSFDHFISSSIWKHVDIIGVNTYFNLCRSDNCTIEELTESWSYWLQYLDRFSISKGKPVYITEIGYYSREGCAINPGDWNTGGKVDYQEQAKAYQAFLCQYSEFANIRGAFWWQWELNNPWNNDSADYTPHGKPAEDIIKQYWGPNE